MRRRFVRGSSPEGEQAWLFDDLAAFAGTFAGIAAAMQLSEDQFVGFVQEVSPASIQSCPARRAPPCLVQALNPPKLLFPNATALLSPALANRLCGTKSPNGKRS